MFFGDKRRLIQVISIIVVFIHLTGEEWRHETRDLQVQQGDLGKCAGSDDSQHEDNTNLHYHIGMACSTTGYTPYALTKTNKAKN